MLRTIRRSVCAVGLTLTAALALAPAAAAAAPGPGAADPDAPRAWSAWLSDGVAWLEAADAAFVPQDRQVVGWRFAASPDGLTADAPRQVPDFEEVCGGQAAPAGQKRVAVAVDFGDAETDAYPGETPPADAQRVRCVVAPQDATGLQLLPALARPRVNGEGRLVALDGYPARSAGDGTEVAAPAAATAQENGGGSALPLLLGGGAAVLAGAGALSLARRRRSRHPR